MLNFVRPATPCRRSFWLPVLAIALLTPAAPAQQIFEGRTDVVEVNVPVTVTGRDGHPVRGLTVDDFTLFDNGKTHEITRFEVIDLEQLVAREGRSKMLDQALPAAARRHFLLLFDLSFATSTNITRARDAARDFVLDQLHPTDLAAVATFSTEFGPRLLVTFTPDRAQLARAIDTIGQQLRGFNADPLRFLVSERAVQVAQALDSSTTDTTGARPSQLAADSVIASRQLMAKRFEAAEKRFERGEISAWSQAMADLARTLNSVKGRKQVLYFSEGFDGRLMLGRRPTGEDQRANEDQLNIMRGQAWMVDNDDLFGNTKLQNDVNQMLREFRRADAIVQAVDIGGLRADQDVRDLAGGERKESLFYMAEGTGGELFDDANDFNHQLGLMLQRSEVTYLLTFRPEKLEEDGSYHKLKVKVKDRRGNRVAHRDGYYAPRPFRELHPLEKTLLASEDIASAVPRQDLGVDLLAVPFMSSEATAYVPVILEVNGASLLAGHQEDQLTVEIYAYVTDELGEIKDFFSETLKIDLTGNRKAMTEGGLKYYGHLDLGLGEHLVRVLVRNADTGLAGVETMEIDVPGMSAEHSHLLPPLFLDEPTRWVLVKETQRESRQETVVYPFIVNGQPYIPAARPKLKRKQAADLCLVAYNLGTGELELRGRILDPSGNEIDGGKLALIERTATGISGLDKLRATFRPHGLQNGDYTLEVAVREHASDWRINSIPFTVLN